MPTGSVDAVVTDPPYGIALKEHGRNGYDWRVIGDESQAVGQEAISMCRDRNWPLAVFAHHRKPWPGEWRQFLVWDKGPAVGGGGDIATCWKFTWDLVQVAGTGRLNGPRDSAVLRYWATQRGYHYHPCQKPVALVAYLISKITQPGETVLDPFMGSGTTGVACVQTGRNFIGIEIDPTYFAIAERRIAEAQQQLALPLEAK